MYMLTGTKSNRFYTICWTTRSNSAIRSLRSRLKPHRAVTKYILPSKIMELAFRNQVSTKYGNVFTKAISPAEKDKKGTGLGLSIVKEIIQAHNENINVISTEGVGTEFIFSLPLTKKAIRKNQQIRGAGRQSCASAPAQWFFGISRKKEPVSINNMSLTTVFI